MNCIDALELLDCVRPNSDDLALPELAAAHAHLASCSTCQIEFARRQQFDARIAASMHQVAIPEGLEQRVLTTVQIDAESKQAVRSVISQPERGPTSDRPASRRRMAKWASAAMALFAVVGFLLWQKPAPTFAPSQLLNLVAIDLSTSDDFDSSFAVRSPSGWNSGVIRFAGDWQGQDLDQLGSHDVAVRVFEGRTQRGTVITGMLMMTPAARVSPLPVAAHFANATPYYLSRGGERFVAATWHEGDVVYLCLVPEDVREFELLQRLLRGTAA